MDAAGDYVRGASGGAVVGFLVSGSRTRRRWIHRAADFQRQGRKKRIVVGALVQPGALRTATLALDSDRARGSGSLSGVGAAGAWLHACGDPADTSCATRNLARGIHGGVHVYGGDTVELG